MSLRRILLAATVACGVCGTLLAVRAQDERERERDGAVSCRVAEERDGSRMCRATRKQENGTRRRLSSRAEHEEFMGTSKGCAAKPPNFVNGPC